MSQKLHQHTFTWPATNAGQVIVTGTFDNWSESVTMQRHPEGGFVAQVDVPWDTTIFFKFVQDGNWLIDNQQPHCDDGSGQINNYCVTPKAPAQAAANTAAETVATLSTDQGGAMPVVSSEPSEPTIVVKGHVDEPADKAPTVPAAPAEAEVVPLAAAVEHPADIVPEAAVGPATHEDPPATTLPIVEVLPSSDALPTTAPVEPAASEPPAPTVAAPVETAPAPAVVETPAPVAEAPLAPPAEVVPAVDDIVYATANTDATADAVVAAAKETAPASAPAAVTDVVAPAITDATPAKVDAAVAEDKPTASPSFETPAKPVGELKDTKPGEPKDGKPPTSQPVAATKTEETKPTPRPDGKGGAKGDRLSHTYSSLKGKLFSSPDHEKTNGVSEHGDAQVTESSPTRERRKSFFGRVASIFKPSS